jgi:hypothetical protein
MGCTVSVCLNLAIEMNEIISTSLRSFKVIVEEQARKTKACIVYHVNTTSRDDNKYSMLVDVIME